MLLDFDLDYCSVAFDGVALRALPRALSALSTGCATLRPDLKAIFMRRALKYGERGFGLALPRRALVAAGGRVVAGSVLGAMAYGKLALLTRERILSVKGALCALDCSAVFSVHAAALGAPSVSGPP